MNPQISLHGFTARRYYVSSKLTFLDNGITIVNFFKELVKSNL